MSSEYEPDLKLKAELDRLLTYPAPSGMWSDVETRARKKGWTPEERIGERKQRPTRKGFPSTRRSGLRVAVFASIAVVLLATVAIGSFMAVRNLARPDFVLAITDDNIVGAGVQSGQWERLPVPAVGGDLTVTSVLVDPNAPSTLYATANTGIYRSTNGGADWTLILKDSSSSTLARGSVILAPSMPSRLYALTDAGLFRSDDSGTNWTQLSGAGLLAKDRTGIYGRLAMVLADQPDTLVAVSEDWGWSPFYLYRSTDAGNSWQRTDVKVGGYEAGYLNFGRGVVADPQHASTIYVLIDSGDGQVYRVSKSTDAGATWTDLAPSEWDVPVVGLSVDPQNSQVVWAIQNGLAEGEHSIVRRSTDGGATWEKVKLEGAADRIMSLVFDPQSANTLYAYTGGTSYWDGTLHRSTDGGATWENIGANVPEWFAAASLVPDAAPGGALYAATTTGLFKWVPGQ